MPPARPRSLVPCGGRGGFTGAFKRSRLHRSIQPPRETCPAPPVTFSLILHQRAPLEPPFRRVYVQRQTEETPRLYAIDEHPDDICALMATRQTELQPVEGDEHLAELLVD